MTDEQLSRRLSYLLRHAPGDMNVTLEPGGWAPLQAVLQYLRVPRERLERVVATNSKQRFSLEGERIRANQGHSVQVDLDLPPAVPPMTLYHGTYPAALPAIRREGVRKMARHHVHLSPDQETAWRVGARRGTPTVLEVRAGAMHAAGHTFFLSANGVWLVEAVPPEFLVFP